MEEERTRTSGARRRKSKEERRWVGRWGRRRGQGTMAWPLEGRITLSALIVTAPIDVRGSPVVALHVGAITADLPKAPPLAAISSEKRWAAAVPHNMVTGEEETISNWDFYRVTRVGSSTSRYSECVPVVLHRIGCP